jgi:hypothetical protein
MSSNKEIELLIKSKYPVVFLESIDEVYCINQLKRLAERLGLLFFQWSVTNGLIRGANQEPYYQTKEPVRMIRMIMDLLRQANAEPSLIVLKDTRQYLEDTMTLRLFKDLVNQIKGTRHTLIILDSEYKLPRDIEVDAAHIVGGFPDEAEISAIMGRTVMEMSRANKNIEVSLTEQQNKQIVRAFNGLSTQQIRTILNRCIIDNDKLTIDDLPQIESCKKDIYDKEGILEFCFSKQKDNIANFDNLKRWLAERKDSFQRAASTSLPAPKGVLLMGVQGCGKSLAVKIIASELGLPLYRLQLDKLYSKYIGETEQNLRKALGTVEKLTPLCLWIDEIEKCFAASAGDIDGGVSQRIMGTFLTWMQERTSNCFIAATANNIHQLPPEFLRKGRFDEIFFVDLPDLMLREQIFRIHLKKRGLPAEKFDCEKLAAASAGFNGAEIEQAVISALYRASSNKETIATEHILDQIISTKPLSVMKREDISALRLWAKDRTISA